MTFQQSFRLFSSTVLLLVSFSTVEAEITTEPLLHPNNLLYLGAFRLPPGFDYAKGGLTYYPDHNSLFINNQNNKISEVSIPEAIKSYNPSILKTATRLQSSEDITEGNLNKLRSGGKVEGTEVNIGDILVYEDKLIGNAYIYYDAGYNAALSHFTSELTLGNTGDFRGMYKVGTLNPGFYSGFMAHIPPKWQTLFGGPVLTGGCCFPIISRTSSGPSAFVFDPDDLGVETPVSATPLLYYDQTHETLGKWSNREKINLRFNMTAGVASAVFPVGFRSVLYFGGIGTSVPCYGESTRDKSKDRKHVSGSSEVIYCYDPINPYKGNHAYPYKPWIWAYDANDLVAVKDGLKKPWEVLPYDVWEFSDMPSVPGFSSGILGVAYDSKTQRLYIAQNNADRLVARASEFNRSPIIQVFQINDASPVINPIPVQAPSVTTSAPTPVSTHASPKKSVGVTEVKAPKAHDVTPSINSDEPSSVVLFFKFLLRLIFLPLF